MTCRTDGMIEPDWWVVTHPRGVNKDRLICFCFRAVVWRVLCCNKPVKLITLCVNAKHHLKAPSQNQKSKLVHAKVSLHQIWVVVGIQKGFRTKRSQEIGRAAQEANSNTGTNALC